MKTYIRLNRSVARTPSQCHRCAYPVVEYQSIYRPTVDDKVLAEFCSERCAGECMTARLEVSYL